MRERGLRMKTEVCIKIVRTTDEITRIHAIFLSIQKRELHSKRECCFHGGDEETTSKISPTQRKTVKWSPNQTKIKTLGQDQQTNRRTNRHLGRLTESQKKERLTESQEKERQQTYSSKV